MALELACCAGCLLGSFGQRTSLALSLSLSVPESVWSAQCFYDERVLQALQAAPSYGSYEALLLHWTVKHGYGDDVLPCSSCRGFGADKVGEVH